MPALAFGLNSAKSQPGISKPSQKRKAFFDDDDRDESDPTPPLPQYGAKKISKPLRPLNAFGDDEETSEPPRKSPKLSKPSPHSSHTKSANGGGSEKYTNLSALRSAKLHDEESSKIDASVYDYDAAYDTFHAPKEKKSSAVEDSKPKYMGSLLDSAEVRKRDQLRAREKLLQREREAEGDEFADKEKFVTGAYKQQQEELKKMEEEEKKREEVEEERRRKGGGMTAFHKRMLEKDEERMKSIQEAEDAALRRKELGEEVGVEGEDEQSESKIAQDLNEKGARIIVNDDGEVVDKRQLLSAGLNSAPKKPGTQQTATKAQDSSRPQEFWRSAKAQDARQSQRERQSRMMERQIEEMTERQQQAEAEEQREQQEKNKSKVTESEKMGARERFLQRKREREEAAQKKKAAGG
jgi:coiled-coil domain-containing protein 55